MLAWEAHDLHDPGPYPPMTRDQLRASLELLPSWVLAQKATANRQVIAVTRQRLAAGAAVARMYQELGLAGLERPSGRAAARRTAGSRRRRMTCTPTEKRERARRAFLTARVQRSHHWTDRRRCPLPLGGGIMGAGRRTARGPAAQSPGPGCPSRRRYS